MTTNILTDMTPYERSLMKGFEVPRPHVDATHAYLLCPKDHRGRQGKATVLIKNFDTLVGSAGKIQFGRYIRKGWVKCGKAFQWDGKKAI